MQQPTGRTTNTCPSFLTVAGIPRWLEVGYFPPPLATPKIQTPLHVAASCIFCSCQSWKWKSGRVVAPAGYRPRLLRQDNWFQNSCTSCPLGQTLHLWGAWINPLLVNSVHLCINCGRLQRTRRHHQAPLAMSSLSLSTVAYIRQSLTYHTHTHTRNVVISSIYGVESPQL